MTERTPYAVANRDLQCIALGMAMAHDGFRQRLEPRHFLDDDLGHLAKEIRRDDSKARHEAIWQFLGFHYQVSKHDGRLSDAVLWKLKIDAETQDKLDYAFGWIEHCLGVYRGEYDKRAFLKEIGDALTELGRQRSGTRVP